MTPLNKETDIGEDDFKDLLKHSEKVANKLWNNKEDEIWDNYLKGHRV
jgi:hypothetical protein